MSQATATSDATAQESAERPSGAEHEASTRAGIDAALATLSQKKAEWASLPIRDLRAILGELIKDFAAVAERWVAASVAAKGLDVAKAGEEWLAGPYFVVRNLRLLDGALTDIEKRGAPRIPGSVRRRSDGQVTARIFPANLYDRLFYSGVHAEVWMEPDVTVETLPQTQAVAYHPTAEPASGRVCLVLGAGNVSSIGPMDVLYKLFVERQVVICKMHPVNAYLGPIMAEGFQALRDWGVLRIVYGGAEEGAYLCEHPEVDEIHITGSDKTVEAIVFGPGEEGQKRKRERRPRLEKTISSELGNVSPVIVVPGPWSASDVAYQAESLASMLTNNAGFNCNAVRVILTHRGWEKRADLLEAFYDQLRHLPSRKAYYPGAEERYQSFLSAHPEMQQLGSADPGELPWAVVPDVDPDREDDPAFTTEAFCGLCCETALEADSAADFLDQAVSFANERLWGTLNVTLLVHPASLGEPELAAAVERAVRDLRYGTVSINNWAAIGYGLVIAPWGAYPGHDLYDIQSGSGVVHNTLMFSRVQKTVVRSPFRMVPKPVWFPSHKTATVLGEKLTRFEASPSPLKLPGIFWHALRG